MPVRPLPSSPNLDHLKHQAKDLMRLHTARDPMIAQKMREFHPRFAGISDEGIFAAALKLSDAQLTIARESGFASWARLKARVERPTIANRLDLPHHERIEDLVFRKAVDLIDAGDVGGLRGYLGAHPGLARQQVVFEGTNYFREPSLLEFIAENPIRHGRMAPHVVEAAGVILEAGVDQRALDETLMLVATGSVAGASEALEDLIDLLCDAGADAAAAARAAAVHGERRALEVLIRRGVRVDLVVAAALNRFAEFGRLLPGASGEERYLALAVAVQYGRVESVRMLLDAGEDPNRYNPVGGHSHGTPLHHAAASGNEQMVRLLIERGARLDVRDVLWGGTPAGWAEHEGKVEVLRYLRERERGV